MRYMLCIIFLSVLTGATAQISPDMIAYDKGYEDVIRRNGIRISYLIVDSSQDVYVPGDTIFTTWYNEKGQWIKDQFMVFFMEDGPFINEYYYDEDGHMIRAVSNADMYPMETGFLYEKGKLVSGYSGGAEARQWEFKTEKGLVVERLGYTPVMFFDEETQEAGEVTWELSDSTVYSYDKQGHLIRETPYYFGEESGSTRYYYSETGRILRTEMVFAGDTEAGMFTDFEYDDRDLLKKATTKTLSGDVTIFRVMNLTE